jgi:predicted DNA-binding protein (MmcQ/YjbR family)
MKMLPPHLKYVFLEEGGRKLVVISSDLTPFEEEKLLNVLKSNQGVIGWTLFDLKGINPSYCMNKITWSKITNRFSNLKCTSIPQ